MAAAALRALQSSLYVGVVFFMASFVFFLLLSQISPGTPALLPGGLHRPPTPASMRRNHIVLPPDRPHTFKAVVFADLHYGEEESGWGIGQDLGSTRVIDAVLGRESRGAAAAAEGGSQTGGKTPPLLGAASGIDLVVLDGDLVTGDNTFRENATGYLDQIVRPLVSRRLPWASTYGNHDSKFNLSRRALFRRETEMYADLSLTNSLGPPGGSDLADGITNYYVLVHAPAPTPPPPSSSSSTPPTLGPVKLILWFLDSRGGGTYQQRAVPPADGIPRPSDDIRDDIPNHVSAATAAWFASTHASLLARLGPRTPSLAFVHIPPHPFLAVQEATPSPPPAARGVDAARTPGLNDDAPLAIQGEGHDDDAFVAALRAARGLRAVFVGHDHGDSWCAPWPPPEGDAAAAAAGTQRTPYLCFAKHSGYGGYGKWRRGARVVSVQFPVDEDAEGDDWAAKVETWVRMENGDVVTNVVLNETYGFDEYPTATGE